MSFGRIQFLPCSYTSRKAAGGRTPAPSFASSRTSSLSCTSVSLAAKAVALEPIVEHGNLF